MAIIPQSYTDAHIADQTIDAIDTNMKAHSLQYSRLYSFSRIILNYLWQRVIPTVQIKR